MHYFVCHYLQFDDITIICLFVILITPLFARSLQRRSSNHNCFVHTQLHTRLIELLLTVVCFVLSNERSWSRRFVFLPSRQLYREHFLFMHSHTLAIRFSLMLVVVGLLGSCSMYLLRCICIVCIVYTLSLVAFAFVVFSLSISFILMVLVCLAFAYCFHVKRY